MNIRPIHVVAVLLLIGGGILAYDALTSSINPYLTVSQASAHVPDSGNEIQVLATVTSWSYDNQGAMHLAITDGNASMEVNYRGMPPQGLQEGQKIVAIGSLAPDHSLNATRILTKCPSKYE